MSKIAIKGNESGTATFTIEAPATNTDRVFELPDEAGKVLTDASDIEPQVKTATNASGAAPVYACRAWVNFDGTTATPSTIRGSGNVSSVTRNGTGNYTVNLTTSMPDGNYATPTSCALNATGSGGSQNGDIYVNDLTTASYRILTSNNGTFTNMPIVTSAIFR